MDQSRPLRVVLGSDQAGFLLKEDSKTFLKEMGYQSGVEKPSVRFWPGAL